MSEEFNETEMKIAPSLSIYPQDCDMLYSLDDETAGKIIKAAIGYYFAGEIPDLVGADFAIFSCFKKSIDISNSKYTELCLSKSRAAKRMHEIQKEQAEKAKKYDEMQG